MKLIFETTHTTFGELLDKPHRMTRVVEQVLFEHRYDGYDHTDLVIRNAQTRRVIASLWEVGAYWSVGRSSYANLRIES